MSPAFSVTLTKAGECLLIDRLLDEPEKRHLAASSPKSFDHRFTLAHAEVVPIRSDERQALARRHVRIDADDRHAALDGFVDRRHERGGIPAHHHHAGRFSRRRLLNRRDEVWNVDTVRSGDLDFHAEFVANESQRGMIMGSKQRQI